MPAGPATPFSRKTDMADKVSPGANPPAAPVMMRAKQILPRYGIGRTYLWELAQLGHLTPVRVSPRVTLWNVAELDAYFSGRKAADAGGA